MRQLIAALALVAATPVLAAAGDAAARKPAGKEIQIKVTGNGFEPREVKVKKGEPTKLTFTRTVERTCIDSIDIPAENVKNFALPLNQAVSLVITPKKAGVEKFHCSAMAMGDGKILVE